MKELLKDKQFAYLLLLGIILITAVIVILVRLFFYSGSKTPSSPLSPTPIVPILQTTLSPKKQGKFTVVFPVAPDPKAITITLATSKLDPGSVTEIVPFSSEFSKDGKLLTITTNSSVVPNRFYTLYVRLVKNNHIIVKNRYISNETGLISIIKD